MQTLTISMPSPVQLLQRFAYGAAAALIIMNLLDAVFTLVYIYSGVAKESNPIMNHFLSFSPVLFVITKMALVSLAVVLLLRLLKQRQSASLALIGTSAAYALLICYHISAVHLLGIH